jgi:hypothetical protein
MRYDSAKENNYIEYITNKSIGLELAQIWIRRRSAAYADKPWKKEGWLKVLSAHWTNAKADAVNLAQLVKTRQQMNELGYLPDTAPAAMYFLTSRFEQQRN